MRTTKLAGVIASAATLLVLTAGCGGNGKSSSVSLSAQASSALTTTAATSGLKVDDHVTLERIRIVVRDVKLEAHASAATVAAQGGGTTATAADDHGTHAAGTDDKGIDGVEHADDEAEVEAGPFLVDLKGDALAASKIQQQIAAVVPDGVYDELKLKIHKLEGNEKTGDAEVDAARASVILDGTFDGKPFQFVSQLEAQQRFEGSFVVGGSTPSNITLGIDVGGWFAGAGSSLDPSVAANRSAIEQSIKRSLRALDDHDHDGKDDHGHDGAGQDDGANHG